MYHGFRAIVTLIFPEAAIYTRKMGTCGVRAMKTENSPTLYPPVQELYSHLEHFGDVQALCGDVQQLVCHACVDALQRLHLARIQFQADLRSQNNQS